MSDTRCACCGRIIPEGRQICKICEDGEPRPTVLQAKIKDYAGNNKKIYDELIHTPVKQYADVLEEYVNKCEFFDGRTIYGALVWECFSQGNRPFTDQWKAAQFIEWLTSDQPRARIDIYKGGAERGKSKK